MNTISRGFSFNMMLMAIKMLMSSVDWEKVKRFVDELDSNTAMTGEEKRELARQRAKEVIKNIPNWILNLAIEVAVSRLRKS